MIVLIDLKMFFFFYLGESVLMIIGIDVDV